MAKQLSIKLVVTANLDNLRVVDFKRKAASLVNAQVQNPTYVPGISPTPPQVSAEIETLDNLVLTQMQIKARLKENSGKIKDQVRKVKNIFVSEWAPQIQNAPGMNAAKVKGLGYGLKGQFNGKSLPEFNMTNSEPVIARIEIIPGLKHNIHIRNSQLKGRQLPHDAKRLEVYMAYGENEPSDIRKMIFLGTASGGKFENEFTPADLGKWVWYIAAYIGKKPGVFPCLSRAQKAIVG